MSGGMVRGFVTALSIQNSCTESSQSPTHDDLLFPWAKSISVSKIDLAATLSHHCSPSRLSHPRPVHTAKLALWTGKKISPLHHLHLELQLSQGRQTVRAAGAAETAPSASCCYDDRRRSSRATAGWSASGSASQSQACRDVDRAL